MDIKISVESNNFFKVKWQTINTLLWVGFESL